MAPPRLLTLEQALEFISEDEAVEVTPVSVRLRKVTLDQTVRGRARKNAARV
jgi:GTP-binding protein